MIGTQPKATTVRKTRTFGIHWSITCEAPNPSAITFRLISVRCAWEKSALLSALETDFTIIMARSRGTSNMAVVTPNNPVARANAVRHCASCAETPTLKPADSQTEAV